MNRDSTRYSLICFSILAIGLLGCDSKSVGIESATEGGSGDASGSGESGDPSVSMTGNSATSASTTDGGCQMPMVAACVECECEPGSSIATCHADNCNRDCSDDACGTTCFICNEGGDTCVEEGHAGICVEGQCVEDNFGGADPCNVQLQEGFEMDLSMQNGCLDILVLAANATDTIALTVSLGQDLVDQVTQSGQSVSLMLDASDPDVDVRAFTGLRVSEPLCNDVIIPDSVVTSTWTGVSGDVSVMVEPPDENDLVFATIAVTEVTLANGDGDMVTVSQYEWNSISVGWLPG